jgi:hypothetical protein
VASDQRGQVAIVVALTLTLMLAFGALVVDVGLNWAARTQLQSAADAAALAGAAELPGRPDEAVAKVRQYLDDNVAGLAGAAAGWESDGDAANGDVTCYRPPAAPPPPGDPAHGCNVGDTAIQVITPPLRPTYAFASILGRRSGDVKALAAAGVPPGPDAPCALCVLSTDASPGLLADGDVALTVAGGGVVVNSDANPAAATTGPARVTVAPPGTIQVVGGVQSDPGGGFDPVPQTGGVPVADPLANLPRPDQLGPQYVAPTFPIRGNVNVSGGGRILQPGIYHQIQASGPPGTTLSFTAGLYVITGELRVSGGVAVTVGNATLYFACTTYPRPCGNGNNGAGLTIGGNTIFSAAGTSDPSSPYDGLAVFYDRNNIHDLVLGGGALSLTGTVYARSAHLRLGGDNGAASLKSMLVVDAFTVSGNNGRVFGLTYLPDLNVLLRNASGGLVK